MHLADAFIQSDLQCIWLYIFLLVYFCDMNYSLQKFGVSKIFIIIISKNTFS